MSNYIPKFYPVSIIWRWLSYLQESGNVNAFSLPFQPPRNCPTTRRSRSRRSRVAPCLFFQSRWLVTPRQRSHGRWTDATLTWAPTPPSRQALTTPTWRWRARLWRTRANIIWQPRTSWAAPPPNLTSQWSVSERNHWLQFDTLRPKQNCRHFTDDIFTCIFLNENMLISLKISLKFVSKVRINNITAVVQIMAWRRPGGKPLSEPMMVWKRCHIDGMFVAGFTRSCQNDFFRCSHWLHLHENDMFVSLKLRWTKIPKAVFDNTSINSYSSNTPDDVIQNGRRNLTKSCSI